jgi:Flp pilus assembly protein TadB
VIKISPRYAHFLYGFIQSGITSGIASAVASFRFISEGVFVVNWLEAWFTSWALMIPVVLFAAPFIRRLTLSMTEKEE